MLNLKPREYQTAIFETAKENNTLVVLPTGLGKTMIALMLAVERIKKYPTSKIIFLAPTRPLVEQHQESFKKNLPELFADLQLFTGSINAEKRKEIFKTAEIIFSTPQCIANDLNANLYNLEDVSLIIFDESHRCLKNYDYTTIVEKYKNQGKHIRILGLTASPGSDPEIVKEICRHLDITSIELKTRESPDVKEYVEDLEFNKIEVEFPKEFIEIKVLLKRIYDSAVLELKEKNLLYGPANKISLLKLQKNLFGRATNKDFSALRGTSLCAQAIKISHGLELLETQTLKGLEVYLDGIQEQATKQITKAAKSIANKPEFTAAVYSIKKLLKEKIEHPKINRISELIKENFNTNPNAKVIIFTQFRETANIIVNNLKEIENIKPAIFVGQSIKKTSTGTSGLNQKQQKQIIEKFRENEINVLCATSIGEEGLDIPEVSAVIFYEPIPSAIRKIQRAGRTARLAPGKLYILITKNTRDEINHYASSAKEKKMYRTISNIQEDMNKKILNFQTKLE